jgi:glycosyltransferase involved in cell wall biosynthesis
MNKTSVIIPTIGRASLTSTLESILASPEFINEIIIVKSCRAELNLDVDIKVKVLEAPISNNVSSARNFGLQNVSSSSEWVAFCDDDDLWVPDKLKSQINYCLEKNLDASFTRAFLMKSEKSVIRPQVEYKEESSPLDQVYSSFFRRDGYLPFPSFCFRSQILKRVSFDEGLVEHEDLLFVHSIYELGCKIGQVPIPLVIIDSDNKRSVKRFSWDQEYSWLRTLSKYSFKWVFVYFFRVFIFKFLLFIATRRKR